MGKQWKQCQTLFLGDPKSLREYDRDDGRSVVERVVVEGDRMTGIMFSVEHRQHFVEQLPAPLPGEYEVAAQKRHPCTSGQVGKLSTQAVVDRVEAAAGPGDQESCPRWAVAWKL